MDNGSFVSGRCADAVRRFGHELRRRRTQAGLTQRQLAERVSYSREMVAAVERGRRYGSQQLAVQCDAVLRTDGILTRLWPLVENEQVAADRRRGPRPGAPRPGVQRRPVPGRVPAPAARSSAAIWAEWASSLRPAIGDPSPELMDQLRDLINNLASANGRTGR